MKATSNRQRKKEYIMNETQRRVSETAGERKEKKKKSDKHENKRSNENGMDSEIKKKTEQNKTETQKGRSRRYKFHATN
jgi:hypothetical protein